MQALMAEANAAKAKAEKEKEAAEAALKAKQNMPVMLRGAKLNIAVKPPVAGNALSAAAAKAAQQQQTPVSRADNSNGGAGSAINSGLAKTGVAPCLPICHSLYIYVFSLVKHNDPGRCLNPSFRTNIRIRASNTQWLPCP
jgi:hypothetical protein